MLCPGPWNGLWPKAIKSEKGREKFAFYEPNYHRIFIEHIDSDSIFVVLKISKIFLHAVFISTQISVHIIYELKKKNS